MKRINIQLSDEEYSLLEAIKTARGLFRDTDVIRSLLKKPLDIPLKEEVKEIIYPIQIRPGVWQDIDGIITDENDTSPDPRDIERKAQKKSETTPTETYTPRPPTSVMGLSIRNIEMKKQGITGYDTDGYPLYD